MQGIKNNVYKRGKLKLLDVLFIAFCLLPFIIPNPIVKTNIQPNAALLGTVVILAEIFFRDNSRIKQNQYFFGFAWVTLIVAVLVMLFTDVTISALRAVFNYYSVAVIPLALYLIFSRLESFPEKLIKTLILVWFFVASVQFFVDRGFLTGIIGGVRYSYSYRGVVGLASEPSFLGIACFCFLHMIVKFKKHQMVFFVLALIMGIVYAQSMMGVLFISAFLAIYLLDVANTRKGLYIWIVVILAVAIFVVLLNTVLAETRLNELLSDFSEEGTEGVLEDASAGARYTSLTEAIADSFSNFLLPLGYTRRIGSGYGGFLCELGFFALPILGCISLAMSKVFKKKICQFLYFVVVTILLFNNTQIGNPMFLFVITLNLHYSANNETEEEFKVVV